jgi:hypothetical protein
MNFIKVKREEGKDKHIRHKIENLKLFNIAKIIN